MGGISTTRPQKKRAGRYHHGDLRRALIDQALRTIDAHGVEGLTLRAVGAALGVSRTALYRHFANKESLLAAVATEGFRTLRVALTGAWTRDGRNVAAFEAMGHAYLQFASDHPSHYRVMFGRFVTPGACDPEFVQEAEDAFGALVDALVEQQRDGAVRADDPLVLARFVWSVVHGVAMLTIDGRLGDGDVVPFRRYVSARIRAAVAAAP